MNQAMRRSILLSCWLRPLRADWTAAASVDRHMKRLRFLVISFDRVLSQARLNASSDGASHKVCGVRPAGWTDD